MRDRPDLPQAASLRPHLIKSLVIHALVFGLISAAILWEGAGVARQESLRIAEVQAEETKQADREREAREQAVEDLLADQLKTEMDALIAGELEPNHEEQLSDQTREDIDHRMEEINYDELLEQLTNEQLAALAEQLRGMSLEQMRLSLQQMRQDLLLSQVRSFIRRVIAPDIKRRIEERLKNDVGRAIQTQAERQSAAEKSSRIGEISKELQAAIRELSSLKSGEAAVQNHLARRQMKDATDKQAAAKQRQAANTERVGKVLQDVQRSVPQLVADARKLADSKLDRQAAKDIEQTTTAIAKAAESDTQARQARAKAAKDKTPQAKQAHAAAEAAAKTDREAAAGGAAQAAEKLTARAAELKQLSDKLTAEQRKRQPDDIQKQVVQVALKDVEPAVREKVEKEVKETAIPLAADRIVQALDKDLQKRKLNTEKFKKFLQKDIELALAEELNRRKPDHRQALLRTEDRFDLRDRKNLDEARKEIAEVAEELKKLAAEQEKVRDESSEKHAKVHAARQRDMAQKIERTKERLAERLGDVRKATVTQDVPVAVATNELRNTQAEDKARQAAADVERKQVDEGKQKMTEVAAILRKTAEKLTGVDVELAKEADQVKARSRKHMNLKEALGAKQAEQAVAKASQAADEAAKQRVKPAVESAARTTEVRNVLGQAEDAQALAKMDALDGKLEQVVENLAEGRGIGQDAGLGLIGPGVGAGLLGGDGGNNWGLPYRRTLSRFNREAYEEFVKDVRHRLNPDNYYGAADEPNDPGSIARVNRRDGAAAIFIESLPAAAADANARREIPEPNFPYKAFGGAAMMDKPVKIDGDLSDWGELRHPLVLQYRSDSLEKVAGGPSICVRWTPDGFYFAYKVRDTNGIQACPEQPWSGDCLEIMIDIANTRRPEAYLNIDAQKFCFTPFGCRGNKQVTVYEMGRGLRGMGMARDYPDTAGIKGASAARIVPGYGYCVEGFISRRAMVRPILMPGRFVAMNFSLNRGDKVGMQWSASQHLQTWHRPDTWGDLLLLGSDAKVRFFIPAEKDDDVKGIVPGDPVGVEIADADMNINTRKIDRVAAEMKAMDSGAALFVVLAETGANTGVFRASIHTQPSFLPAKANTLNVRAGSRVQLVYNDLRAEYGESNRKVKAELPVGWPVMKVGGK
ncbi:MAG TPA: sugar-binding protein [Phycisphaerae bacterium]|nr:sugar-binding protein [Phycisphaerae bacterium]HUT56968.1 sugar-binding protein [Phycisphaerae bacterium]